MLKTAGVRVRIGLGFAVVLALLVTALWFSLSRMERTKERLDLVLSDNVSKTEQTAAARTASIDNAVAIRNVVEMALAKADYRAEIERIKTNRAIIASAEEKLSASIYTGTGKALLAKLRDEQKSLVPLVEKAIAMVYAGRPTEAAALLVSDIRPLQRKLLADWQQMSTFQAERLKERAKDAKAIHGKDV